MKKLISLTSLICVIFASLAGCIAVTTPADTAQNTMPGAAIAADTADKNGPESAAETGSPDTFAATDPVTERQTEAYTEDVTAPHTEKATEAVTEKETAADTKAPETTGEKETEPASTQRPPEPQTTERPPEPTEPVTDAPVEPREKLDVDLRNFDIELMKFIKTTQDGNYMISPLSLRYALGMLIAGSAGRTLNELLGAFHVTDVGEFEEYIKQFNAFEDGFNESAGKEEEERRMIRLANSVWKREDLPDFNENYKLRLQMYKAEHYDFELTDIVKRVNEWAKIKTEGMIPELLPADFSTDNLAVILMNALYFKSSWVDQFSCDSTREGDFTKADGTAVTKQFMKLTDSFRYYSDNETTLVTVPMKGSAAVTFVLGKCDNVLEKLDAAEYRNVEIKIPKFEVETSLDNKELVNFMHLCGADLIFSESADFSEMIDHHIYVNDIIQKTKISLDEYGVEAAAVTVIDTREKAADPSDPVRFYADRPFSFFIHTTTSEWTGQKNVIMFEGEITE